MMRLEILPSSRNLAIRLNTRETRRNMMHSESGIDIGKRTVRQSTHRADSQVGHIFCNGPG